MPFAILMLLTTDRDVCITDMTVSGDHRLTCPRQALCCETGIYGIITSRAWRPLQSKNLPQY